MSLRSNMFGDFAGITVKKNRRLTRRRARFDAEQFAGWSLLKRMGFCHRCSICASQRHGLTHRAYLLWCWWLGWLAFAGTHPVRGTTVHPKEAVRQGIPALRCIAQHMRDGLSCKAFQNMRTLNGH
jgi:hypothetical protein